MVTVTIFLVTTYRHAAVDDDLRARNETRLVRRQKQHRIGGVAPVAGESQGDALHAAFEERFHVAAGALLGEAGLHHRRMQLARDNRVHPDVLRRVLHRYHARKLDHAGLGGRIGDLRRAAPANAGRGGDVDDRAAALLLHHRQHVFTAEEYALQVEVHLRVEHFLRHLDRAACGRAADVVHQDVDAAEALHARLDHGAYIGAFRDITNVRGDAGRLCQRFFHALRIAIDGQDLRAFFDEAHRSRTAVAPAGPDRARARDDRNLAFKPGTHRDASDCRR